MEPVEMVATCAVASFNLTGQKAFTELLVDLAECCARLRGHFFIHAEVSRLKFGVQLCRRYIRGA
jgi:hypothetical protein